ncbi:1,6-anhydro-N-acetylmuramyl-L-alanine amidase [hydrothermal vent metagenome]|uniref:1,6-anhydro-N-acetylmuramyl-L-alanine amidase AmpD n=1 Tax=hydrothermal vent metagenome TaxID=652676 RepID=A0A3B0XAI6_9ZZZZ
MKINVKSGLIEGVTRVLSANHDNRPEAMPVSLIVIHNISLPPGEFGGPYISQLFTNQLNKDEHPYFEDIYQLRVSSHVLIRRDGEVIQYVPFHFRAWHAGVSVYHNKTSCNDFSIGIELEGTDNIPYEARQYTQLAELITELRRSYPGISKDAITGHSDISPGRKTDPGPAFDWNKLQQLTFSMNHNPLKQAET